MHVAIPIYGKAVTDAGTVRCHAGMATDYKACRNGNVPFRDGYMPMENGLWQRYLSV